MKILVTGSDGFAGSNLVWNLKNIRDCVNSARSNLQITEIYSCDKGTSRRELEMACEKCDFVFHLAGVNRPEKLSAFMENNLGFTLELLELLRMKNNTCPVMLASSVQAELTGRFKDSEYGKSKLAAEEAVSDYAEKTGAKVLIYRFPNLFGKWCRPDYNSVVATFCNAFANDLDYVVNDRNTLLDLVYIDDLVHEMLDALEGKEHRTEDGKYCRIPVHYHVTLGEIIKLLENFKRMQQTPDVPEMPPDSFAKKLCSTYVSYLPPEKLAYKFKTIVDARGTFAELLHTMNCGQVSVNVTRPGSIRGQHWHNSKWEIFIVVSGHGLIQQRRIGISPETGKEYSVIEFEVNGDQMQAIQMIPGYTHNIINLSETQDLITVMWANENFDPEHPDTYYEPVTLTIDETDTERVICNETGD